MAGPFLLERREQVVAGLVPNRHLVLCLCFVTKTCTQYSRMVMVLWFVSVPFVLSMWRFLLLRAIKKLLKRGGWLDWRSGASGAVIELQYRKETPHMNIKISTAERKEMEEENVQRLMFNINFHHDFKAEEQKEREEYINSIEIRCAEVLDFLKKLPFL